MRRLLVLIALVAGTLLPAAGASAAPLSAPVAAPLAATGGSARADHAGLGIRLVDAPVATRDDPRARVYIIDHVNPGTTIERRIEVSNGTGQPTDVAVYAAAAAISRGSFVGLEGRTPNDLSSWTTISRPRLRLADGVKRMVDVTIDVPSDAPPGEQYAVLWAQTSSTGDGAVTQVSRVGIRVYLSVGPGGPPASAFDITSFTAQRDPSGAPMVAAMVANTGGRALDLRGELTLSDGPGGLSAGPFPVELGTTLGRNMTEPVSVRLDPQLPNGPWKAHLDLTSGLLTETADAALTFPESGTGQTVATSPGASLGWWLGIALLGLLLLALAWRFLMRRSANPARRPVTVALPREISS